MLKKMLYSLFVLAFSGIIQAKDYKNISYYEKMLRLSGILPTGTNAAILI